MDYIFFVSLFLKIIYFIGLVFWKGEGLIGLDLGCIYVFLFKIRGEKVIVF